MRHTKYNEEATPTIGGFSSQNDTGFKSTLAKLQESFQSKYNFNYLKNAPTIMDTESLQEQYMDILMSDYENVNEASGSELLQRHQDLNYKKLSQLLENNRERFMNEAAYSNGLEGLVALTFPMTKMYWMTNVYKDFLPTEVATSPSIVKAIKMEYVEDNDGNRYMLPDALLEETQMEKIFGSVRQMLSTDDIPVPSLGFDLLTPVGGSTRQGDSVSTNIYISEIEYKFKDTSGSEKKTRLKQLRIKVDLSTSRFERFEIKDASGKVIDILNADIDFEKGILSVGSVAGAVTAIKVVGHLSSENHLRTATTNWEVEKYRFAIPDGEHLTANFTQEKIKDAKVLYDIDEAADRISTLSNLLLSIKDFKCKKFLKESKQRLIGTKYYVGGTFDLKPPTIMQSLTDWTERELKETIARTMQDIKYVLRAKQSYVGIMCHPKTARLIKGVKWTYTTGVVGGCKIDYQIGFMSEDSSFFLVSSERAEKDNLQMILVPLDENYMTYKLFEYQHFVSTEYRTANSVLTPAVMVSDRYLVDEMLPVQGDLQVFNNLNSSSAIYKAKDAKEDLGDPHKISGGIAVTI